MGGRLAGRRGRASRRPRGRPCEGGDRHSLTRPDAFYNVSMFFVWRRRFATGVYGRVKQFYTGDAAGGPYRGISHEQLHVRTVDRRHPGHCLDRGLVGDGDKTQGASAGPGVVQAVSERSSAARAIRSLFLKEQRYPQSPLFKVYEAGCTALGGELTEGRGQNIDLFTTSRGLEGRKLNQLQIEVARRATERSVADEALMMESRMDSWRRRSARARCSACLARCGACWMRLARWA